MIDSRTLDGGTFELDGSVDLWLWPDAASAFVSVADCSGTCSG